MLPTLLLRSDSPCSERGNKRCLSMQNLCPGHRARACNDHMQMHPCSCLSATAIHFLLIPTRIPHHSPAKGKVAVTANTTNCKEFTELSLPVKWAQPFLFPNHELSGQDFSGKRVKNGWIGQEVWQPLMAAGTHWEEPNCSSWANETDQKEWSSAAPAQEDRAGIEPFSSAEGVASTSFPCGYYGSGMNTARWWDMHFNRIVREHTDKLPPISATAVEFSYLALTAACHGSGWIPRFIHK